LAGETQTKNKLVTKNKIEKQCKQNMVLLPKLPLTLVAKKPKPKAYPKQILTVGDEFKAKRLDKGVTQHQVAEILNVNRNFIYELELGKRKLTIFALHKVYLFLKYIPKTLSVDERTLQGKLFAYRIKNELTYSKLSKEIGLDKSTLIRFEKDKTIKNQSAKKISLFFSMI